MVIVNCVNRNVSRHIFVALTILQFIFSKTFLPEDLFSVSSFNLTMAFWAT